MSVKNGPTKGLTKTYCPARIGMTLETLDIKLHFFFSFPGLLRLPAFETTVFIRWQGGKIFSFKLAGNSYSGGYPLPPAHINHGKHSAGIQREERGKSPRISLQGADKMAATVPPPPLWLNATCSRWGSNQSSPLLAQSKGIFIDTLALTLAPGSALSAGGPRASPEPASVFLFRGAIVCHDLQEFVDTTYSTPGTRCTILKNRERTKCAVDQREWETQVIKHVLRIKLSADLKARDGIQKILKGWRALNSLMQNKRKISDGIFRWIPRW